LSQIEVAFTSSIIGAILGGLISWCVTSRALDKKFKHENEVRENEEKLRYKRLFLMLKDELATNQLQLTSFFDYFKANPKNDYVDLRELNNLRFKTRAWQPFKGYILILD